MNRDELLAAVPVHRQGGGAFVVLAEIPQPWRDQFAAALRGSAAPPDRRRRPLRMGARLAAMGRRYMARPTGAVCFVSVSACS